MPKTPNPEEVFVRGHEFLEEGNLEKALESFDQVTQLAPDHPVGYWMKGLVLCTLERFEEAVWATKAGLDIFPDEPGALLNFGRACIETGRLDAARVALQRSVEVAGTREDAAETMPNTLLWLGFAVGMVAAHTGTLEMPAEGPTWEALHSYLLEVPIGQREVQHPYSRFLFILGCTDAGVEGLWTPTPEAEQSPLEKAMHRALNKGLPPLPPEDEYE
jgi:tetratricopeptide (TPR) repeat protein